jgi:hypothetical protein
MAKRMQMHFGCCMRNVKIFKRVELNYIEKLGRLAVKGQSVFTMI